MADHRDTELPKVDEPYDPIETDRDDLDLTWLRTMMTIAGCVCLGSALVILIASGWWAALYF